MTKYEQIASIVLRQSDPVALKSAAHTLETNHPGTWWAIDIANLFREAAEIREQNG